MKILYEANLFIEKQQNSFVQDYVCNVDTKVGEIKSKNGKRGVVILKVIYDEEEQQEYEE